MIRSPFGNLTNLDYPSSPRDFRYQGCETLVHAHPDDRVIISFDKFILEMDIGPELAVCICKLSIYFYVTLHVSDAPNLSENIALDACESQPCNVYCFVTFCLKEITMR